MDNSKLFFLITFVVIFVVIALFSIASKKAREASGKKDYDERQILARGNAYKYSFFTCMIEMAIAILIADSAFLEKLPITTTGLIVFALFIPLVVFTNYAVCKEAFEIDRKPKSIVPLYIIIGLINLLEGCLDIVDGTILDGGKLSGRCSNLLLGILFIEILIVRAIHNKLVNKDEEEE